MRRALGAFALMVLMCGIGASCKPRGEREAGGGASSPALKGALAASADEYKAGWVAFCAANPKVFEDLIVGAPDDAWVRYYERRFRDAARGFSNCDAEACRIGEARAFAELADVYARAWRLALDIEARYADLLVQNASRIGQSPIDRLMIAHAALRRGKYEDAGTLFAPLIEQDPTFRDPLSAAAAVYMGEVRRRSNDPEGARRLWKQVEKSHGSSPTGLLVENAILDGRPLDDYGVSAKALDGASPRDVIRFLLASGRSSEALVKMADVDPRRPEFSEVDETKGESTRRPYYNPDFLMTMSSVFAAEAARVLEEMGALGARFSPFLKSQGAVRRRGDASAEDPSPPTVSKETLPFFLFSRWPTPEHLIGTDQKGRIPFQRQFDDLIALHGNGKGASDSDRRLVVKAADSLHDALDRTIVGENASDVGETIRALKLVDADVALAIRAEAGEYEKAERLRDALFLLEHSMEKEDSGIGYINDPRLFIAIVRVYCALGRYREALNYSYKLVEFMPDLWMIQEILGSLSILGTVDHSGLAVQQD